MKLKKLEITGFKSFREKVILDVADGITCVVGRMVAVRAILSMPSAG